MKPAISYFCILSTALIFSVIAKGQTPVISGASVTKEEKMPDSVTVYVTFTVETTGKISNVKVSHVDCKHCSREYEQSLKKEAVRTVKAMPDWKPSKQRVHFSLPIKLVLEPE